MAVFITAQKLTIHLGYFCKKNFHQEQSKIAQSGHTPQNPKSRIQIWRARIKTKNAISKNLMTIIIASHRRFPN